MEKEAKGRVCRVCLEEAKKRGVAAHVQPRLPPAPGGNVGARCLRPPQQVLAASWSVHHLPTRPLPTLRDGWLQAVRFNSSTFNRSLCSRRPNQHPLGSPDL